MDLNIHVYLHYPADTVVVDGIAQLSKGQTQIMVDLAGLTAEVARNTSVEKSALVLIQSFAAQLAAAGTDPVKLQALQDSLKANDDELAAAVAANTVPAPTPAPAPAPAPAGTGVDVPPAPDAPPVG